MASCKSRSQGEASIDALTASIKDLLRYAEVMNSSHRHHWNSVKEKDSTLILLNNTISIPNSQGAQQLQLKPIGSKWIYKSNHNPDGFTKYNALIVIQA